MSRGRPNGTSIFDRDPALRAAVDRMVADGLFNIAKIRAALCWVDGVIAVPSTSSLRHYVAKHHAAKVRKMTTPAKVDIAAALRLASNDALVAELQCRLSQKGGAK